MNDSGVLCHRVIDSIRTQTWGKKEGKMRIPCCLSILTFANLHAGSFGAGSRALVGRGVRGVPAVLRGGGGGGGGGGGSGSAAGLACKSASSTESGSGHDHGGEHLRVMLLSGNARLPSRGSPQAAGYDLFSAEDCVVEVSGRRLVKTDIAIAIPEGHYGRIAPRSGLAAKHGIDIGAGVIDRDYRGNVGILMCNNGAHDFNVKAGERIAQLILERCSTPEIRQVSSLDDTLRGEGGFGSTGK